jgi:hypothetical protein
MPLNIPLILVVAFPITRGIPYSWFQGEQEDHASKVNMLTILLSVSVHKFSFWAYVTFVEVGECQSTPKRWSSLSSVHWHTRSLRVYTMDPGKFISTMQIFLLAISLPQWMLLSQSSINTLTQNYCYHHWNNYNGLYNKTWHLYYVLPTHYFMTPIFNFQPKLSQ